MQQNRAPSRILYLLHKGLSPLSTNNKSIPYIYLDDTITMAVIITARNSLHSILNFQFFQNSYHKVHRTCPKSQKPAGWVKD